MNDFNIRSGLIYRNPRPHVTSKQAYFPSVVLLDNGEMLSSIVIGEAFESVNSDTYILRSTDLGETWSQPLPLLSQDHKFLCSNTTRISSLPLGEVVAFVVKSHRESHPEEGLANPDNIGFVPTDLLIIRSHDYGKTWEEPYEISPPLIGPSFELCSPIVVLEDGRWFWPTSTWRGWDGDCPNGMKMIVLVSFDQGKSWPEYIDVMNGSHKNVIYWESKVIELSDGRLLAIAWAFDEVQCKDLPNHFTLSYDGGKTWKAPMSTSIQGQTMAITELPDGRLFTVYRRMDKPGLWSTISRLVQESWVNENEIPLWGSRQESLSVKTNNMVNDFNELKFGAPCITILPDNSLYIAFWCYEKMVSNIRWIKLTI